MNTIANVTAHILITPADGAVLNGKCVSKGSITDIYRELQCNYPKFFKMDALCKLGFVAAELLLRDIPAEQKENAAIVLFNRNGSLITDRNYCSTIKDDYYFPSPALFVYTLANIMTGEIAIRHKIYGETSFYLLPHPDPELMEKIATEVYLTSSPSFVLTGWVDYENDNEYLADIRLINK